MSREPALTRGLSHVALVCSDMYETVKFWEDIGIPLVKMEELPGGGQHSFHDMGNGAMLSYMTFADAPGASASTTCRYCCAANSPQLSTSFSTSLANASSDRPRISCTT